MTNIRSLRELNLDDLVRALGLGPLTSRLPAVRRLLDPPAVAFARILGEFDQRIASEGLKAAAAWTLDRLGCRVDSPSPAVGQGLYVANHPGLGDALALFSRIGSPDLRILALDRPVLRLMPHLAQHLILLTPGSGAVTALRNAHRHLERRGSLLTFPAGRIEPDPAWSSTVGFQNWSDSPLALIHRSPEVPLRPVIVSGVRQRRFVDPWLMRWHRRPEDRDWGGAILQLSAMIHPHNTPTTISLRWGAEIAVTGSRAADHDALVASVSALARLSRR